MAPLQRNGCGISTSPIDTTVSPARTGSRGDDPDLDCLSPTFTVPLDETNAELQERFEKKMKSVAKMASHSNVAVLLISWEKEGADYLDTDDEVNELGTVFKEKYNFHVYKERLHTKKGKSAKHQMNKHLAQFVLDEDGEDTLLIIYYAGHGMKDKETGLLRLVGGNPKRGDKSLTQIVWTEVERTIIDETQADLFLIFDCCYAGQLAKPGRSAGMQIFDFLGSTQMDSTALSPGPESFTTALTWALKELANEHGFTSWQLQQKIMEAPHFPRQTQVPCWAERLPSLRRLKIAPLPKNAPSKVPSDDKNQEHDTSTVEYFLNLEFLFSECPTKNMIDDLAKQLRSLVKERDLPLQQVMWRGLFSGDDRKERFSDVARKVLFQLRRKSLSSKLKFQRLTSLLQADEEGPSRKRVRIE